MPWVVVGAITLAFVLIFSNVLPGSSTTRTKLTFNEMRGQISKDNVTSLVYNRDTGEITGTFRSSVGGNAAFASSGPPGNLDDGTTDSTIDRGWSIPTGNGDDPVIKEIPHFFELFSDPNNVAGNVF